jgi:hypothetical protein
MIPLSSAEISVFVSVGLLVLTLATLALGAMCWYHTIF